MKNQQFALAEQIRQIEKKVANVRAQNETLLARVTELSSAQGPPAAHRRGLHCHETDPGQRHRPAHPAGRRHA